MSEWISIDERLPEHGQDVLVARPDFQGGQQVVFESYVDVDKYTRGFYWDGEMDTNLTHWMPLPEPPNN